MKRMVDDKYLKTIESVIDENGNIRSMNNILDSDGNPRFIGGSITKSESFTGDITIEYAKWTLSGSHLMLVFMFIVNEDVTISGNYLADITIPDWLGAKIYPMNNTNHVAVKDSVYGYQANNLQQSTNPTRPYLFKLNNTKLYFMLEQGDLETGKTYRIQFDLVIE